jgi:integrase
MAKKLTDRVVEQFKPGATRLEIPDGGCAGLYLVIQPNGTKSWSVRYRSPTLRDKHDQRASRKLTLGPVAAISLKQAHKLAKAALEEVERGIDPATDKRAEKTKAKADAIAARDNTVDVFMVEFLQRYHGKRGLRDSTRNHTAALFGLKMEEGQWIPNGKGVLAHWSGRPIASITKQDARDMLHDMASKHGVLANRTLTSLKTLFTWILREHDVLQASPVAMLARPAAETKRSRVLSPDEIKALWAAAGADEFKPFGRMVRLLLLTGARRDEIREAPWSEIHGDTWKLPGDRTKNRNPHNIPLSPLALQILGECRSKRVGNGRLVFTMTGTTPISGLSKAKARLDVAMGAKDWTLHDIRRTVATHMGEQCGVLPHIVEAALNHVSGAKAGVAGVYNHATYADSVRAAFEAWGRYVEGLVNGASAGANVVPLHGVRQ